MTFNFSYCRLSQSAFITSCSNVTLYQVTSLSESEENLQRWATPQLLHNHYINWRCMWQLNTMHLRYVTTYFQNLIHRHCVLFLAPELIYYLSERPQNVSTAAGLCILLQVLAGNGNQTSPWHHWQVTNELAAPSCTLRTASCSMETFDFSL